MTIKNYLKVLVLLLAASVHTSANAQNGDNLFLKIQKANNAGTTFQAISLFHQVSGQKHNVLKQENLLSVDKAAVENLYGQKPNAVAISFTDYNTGKSYTLEMLRSKPVSANANFGYIQNGFRFKTAFTDGLHYQGALLGVKKSLATMSVFEDGTVMILFANDDGNFVVGRLDDGSGNYVFYNDQDMINRPASPCGTRDDAPAIGGGSHAQGKITAANLCNKVQVYWECDYQFYQSKGSLTASVTYMTGLFNQFQAMYVNENISVELKSLYVWVTDDAYPNTSSTVGLDIFKGYWNGRGDDFDGDIAHFITKDGHGNGGLAYVDVIGIRSYAYAYSEIQGSYSTIPAFSWDVEVLTHETGHNLGSRHTHWCGWMTGPGGTCGSIDNCYTQEPSTTCSSCSYKTYDNAQPSSSWTGTVMSYCHLVARGINLANGFGPLPGNVIRSTVSTSSVLNPVISAKLTTTPICTSDGSIVLSWNADNFGVAPYSYAWSNGGNTQNLSGLTTPGSYTVTITDANSCTGTAMATVYKYAQPGNAAATGYTKPVCCDQGPATVTLTASVPTDLTNCQTVAWLRTPAAITTYAAAQTAFASATSADILGSTNSNSISNATAAALSVTSPSPCVAQSYYYTPFVTRKKRTANTITATTSTTTAETQNSVTIGAYVAIGDQTSSVSACDPTDTPTVKTLAVTITGYTGRSNNMTLMLVGYGRNGQVVKFRADGLPGNGVYTLPLDKLDNSLSACEIHAFDFNCTSSTSCTSSTVNISATRTVTYPAITSILLDKVCVVGSSVQLGFAPTDCELVNGSGNGIATTGSVVGASLNVYPNPASKSVTVQFYANASGTAQIKVTDMLGKVIEIREVPYYNVDNLVQIDVHSWAKGVYSLSFDDGAGTRQNVKLIVQ